ncbi:MAG: preprotein translocase subunit SecY [Dehalococcoidales bacterium]|nr:preprotein translocase subunit SecY [Dehalococcoidales bacterium]MDP6576715.1 preprotein translocase subunit SecY [Dehalococcoidales bacterium]MDP6824691.1 preprotein translocase subunit SecY [Dehalococcoidales bacterium]
MRARQSRPRLLQAMFDAFSLPDLRRRILITIGILVIFRFVAHVPLPGVDLTALEALFERNALLGMLDMFSGGAMRRLSVAAMGVYPYITSSIIMMLLVPVIPRLQALSREGESGRNKINLITHWLVVPLAGIQGYGQLVYLQREGVFGAGITPGVLSMTAMVLSMVAGTIFLVWLGELITEYGIGNGISIIIFGGIVARLPEMIGQGFLANENFVGLTAYLAIAVLTIVVIVIFTEAHRRIPVQYAKSVFRSGRMYRQAGSTHIPLRVNSAGMIPLIFAMSLVLFPGIVASYFANSAEPNFANTIMNLFNPNTALPLGLFYWGLYFIMAMAFAFFYTMVIFQQQDLPNTLQRQGGFIPGIRPGKNTATYLNGVINRITWGGALFLAGVAVMPFVAKQITGVQVIQLSSLGLLIMVGVVLDTMKQLEAQLVMRRYEGFIK